MADALTTTSPAGTAPAHAHAHGHDPLVAHHFHDLDQQHHAAKLGVWVFLVTEILLFGGLFCFYSVFRAWHPEMFHNCHQFLNWKLGALNTVVLIASSGTVALAIRAIQRNQRQQCIWLLIITILCAFTFMVVKYFEYSHKIHDGLLPGMYFTSTEVPRTYHVFFSIYFTMTGLHGIHVMGGMFFMIWLVRRLLLGQFDSTHYTAIEMGGLYWHLVDLIWIYLFPLLYLVG